MATVIITLDVQGNSQVTASAGTAFGGLRVSLPGSGVADQVVNASPWVASFQNVPAGTYTAVSTPVDSHDNAIGAAVSSGQFTVEPDVTLEVPVVASVSAVVQ